MTRHAEPVLGALVALSGRLSEPVERFTLILVRADPDLGKVAAGVLRLGEIEFGRLLGPEVCLGVGLGKDAGRADEIPRRQGEAGRRVILLRGNVCRVEYESPSDSDDREESCDRCGRTVIMNAERRILRAAHLAVFVALAELVRRRSVLQLGSASEKLGGIVFVLRIRVTCVSEGF